MFVTEQANLLQSFHIGSSSIKSCGLRVLKQKRALSIELMHQKSTPMAFLIFLIDPALIFGDLAQCDLLDCVIIVNTQNCSLIQ